MDLPEKPKHVHNLEFVRLLTPYVFSLCAAHGKRVLDVGCGFGHGAWLLLTSGAQRVVALDYDPAKGCQTSKALAGVRCADVFVMDAQKLAFKDESFDVVTCFEVIEHVPEPGTLLSELRRVVKRKGIVLLSTPNRALRLLPFQRPWNVEHLREYGLSALRSRLSKHFPSFRVLGVRGRPEPYEFYRKRWRQRPLRAYLGWAVPLLRDGTPAAVRAWIKGRLREGRPTSSPHSDEGLTSTAIPAPRPEEWPFFVGNIHTKCLDFFAVCGFEDRLVYNAARHIGLSVCPAT